MKAICPMCNGDPESMCGQWCQLCNKKGTIEVYPIEEKANVPKVVTLCGSTKFKEAFEKAERDLALQGVIVLTVGPFGHIEGLDMGSIEKLGLDQLHFRKIDLSDEILVLNVGGYIGSSTRNEINYALEHGKNVVYLEDITKT